MVIDRGLFKQKDLAYGQQPFGHRACTNDELEMSKDTGATWLFIVMIGLLAVCRREHTNAGF